MVNKIISRRGKRTKYSKRKRFSKYRKHHTRKFGKRIQRRVRRLSRSKKGGGEFDLVISSTDTRLLNMSKDRPPPPIYKGFALVKKYKFGSRESSRQIIIFKYKNNQEKTMLLFVKCKSDKECDGTYNPSSYKVYTMENLHEEETNGNTKFTKFVFDIGGGGGKYKIKLTGGVNGYTIEGGITELRKAIQEQKDENINN